MSGFFMPMDGGVVMPMDGRYFVMSQRRRYGARLTGQYSVGNIQRGVIACQPQFARCYIDHIVS